MSRWPLILIGGLSLGGILTVAGAPTRGLIIGLAACGLGVVFHVLDDVRKTTVIFYDLGPEAMAAFQRFLDAFNTLASAGGVWHVSASGGVRDRKYHAGASTLVERARIQPRRGAPPLVKTNIDVPTIRVGRQLLAFLPDRVLVFDSGAVGAVGYPDLTLEVNETRFIEEGAVPTDTKTVDTTWKYVNKKGGPDKRFKNNRQLPIVLYENMLLLSPTGLREMLQISRTGVAGLLADAAKGLAKEAAAVGARPNPPADRNNSQRNDLADAGPTPRT